MGVTVRKLITPITAVAQPALETAPVTPPAVTPPVVPFQRSLIASPTFQFAGFQLHCAPCCQGHSQSVPLRSFSVDGSFPTYRYGLLSGRRPKGSWITQRPSVA